MNNIFRHSVNNELYNKRNHFGAYLLMGFLIILTVLIAACPTPEPPGPDPEPTPVPGDTATSPGEMLAPNLTAGNGQVTVEWTAPDDG
ncbi:MAG: hypothetical protein ACR2PY_02515, partial [Salinispira sp.]